MSFESYEEVQQHQQELAAQTAFSPALSSVFGSSSLGTLGSSAAFSPNAFTPPVGPGQCGAGPHCAGERTVGLPMAAPPLMHSQQKQQQHSPSALERFEQMQMQMLLQQQAQAVARQQQQHSANAPGFGAIGSERVRLDSHTGSGSSYNQLASPAASCLDSSFSQLLSLDPATGASALLCPGTGSGVTDEQLQFVSPASDLRSCFAPPPVGDPRQPMPMQHASCNGPGMAPMPNGFGLSAAAALHAASAQNKWPIDEPCASDPRTLCGQQHF